MSQTTSTATSGPKEVKQAETPFRIKSLRREEEYLKAFFYGAHGAGKTTLAGSAADCEELQDIIFINIESGTLTFWDNERIKHPENVDVIDLRSFRDMGEIYKFLSAYCRHRESGNKEMMAKFEAMFKGVTVEELGEPSNYKTIIIDSLSELEAHCMAGLLGYTGEQAHNAVFNGQDVKVAEFREYKQNNNMVNTCVRMLRDLPMNLGS